MLSLGTETAHAQLRLDNAIQSAAESLSSDWAGARIAVISFASGSDRMSNYLIDGMIDAFVGMRRFTVISRSEIELNLVRGELYFQMSAEVDEETAHSIGRWLGVQYIITGTFEPHMNAFRFRARVICVETLIIRDTVPLTVRRCRFVRYLLGERRPHAALFEDPARFWSVGASAGTSLASEPRLTGALQATLAPLRHSFVRIGCDLGVISSREGVEYFAITPFIHYAFFLPFNVMPMGGGWHIGIGGGVMMERYRFGDFVETRRFPVADFSTGFILWNRFDVSYTIRLDRPDFSNLSLTHKFSVGFAHRFIR